MQGGEEQLGNAVGRQWGLGFCPNFSAELLASLLVHYVSFLLFVNGSTFHLTELL